MLTARVDLYEAFNWNYNPAKDPDYPDSSTPQINLWPKDMPEFEEKLSAYQTEMIRFARRLTRIFALALHVSEDFYDENKASRGRTSNPSLSTAGSLSR